MLSAMIAVLSAVYQTHQAVKRNRDETHPEEERAVLKLWTILGVFMPFHFYFEAVAAVVPMSSVIFFIPSVLFPLFYLWLSVPSLGASSYIFDQVQPVMHSRILPVVHARLVVAFCTLQQFFLSNFMTVLSRDDLDALHDSMVAAERDLRRHRDVQ